MHRVRSNTGLYPCTRRNGSARRCVYVALAVVFFRACSIADTVSWHFFPAGTHPHTELAQSRPDFDRTGWTQVTLPHSFDSTQPQDNVYGWYAHTFRLPPDLTGHDLILDLGHIDDVDVTYVNGVEVGRSGSFSEKASSAWNQDRQYRVPASVLKAATDNIVLVQVKDFGGIGGLLGQPYIGAGLVRGWKCRFFAGDGAPEELTSPELDDSAWPEIRLPDFEWDIREPTNPSVGWYRFTFSLTDALHGSDLFVDLGRVYDVAICYLNGRLVGQIGKSPPEPLLETAGRFRCILPAELLKRSDNVLAIRLYNHCEFGGLAGVPSVSIADHLTLRKAPSLKELSLVDADAVVAALGSEAALRLCDYLVHSGMAERVAGLCGAAAAQENTSKELAHRTRCLRINALWLSGRGDAAWQEFLTLDFSRPIPYSTSAAMAAHARTKQASPKWLVPLGKDTTTQGDWDLRYGLDEAVLCAMAAPYDVKHGIGAGLRFRVETCSKTDVVRAWIGAKQTTEKRALFLPMSKKRRYASWDDCGETRPFDDGGPGLCAQVAIPVGWHLLSFYLLDWDWHAGMHPRMQTLYVFDQHGALATVTATGKFGQGQYERFLVEGPRELSVRINKHRGPCAVVSGVFLDKAAALQAPPMPTRTEGRETAKLRTRYEALRERSRKCLGDLVASAALRSFERDCVAATSGEQASDLFWWLFECRRIRADHDAAQRSLLMYLDTVSAELPRHQAPHLLRGLWRKLERMRYRPESILSAMARAASVQRDGAETVFQAMVGKSRLGSVRRASERWLALNPLGQN